MAVVVHPSAAHAIMAGRGIRRVACAVALHPGWWAALCWFIWRALSVPANVLDLAGPATRSTEAACTGEGITFRSCAPVPAGHGAAYMAPTTMQLDHLAKTAAFVADLAHLAGMALATVAIALFVFSLFTTPTHMVGSDRRLRAVGRGIGRPTVAARAANRGAYQRIRAPWGGFSTDWSASKRDAAAVDKRLARVGNYRARRWGRRWSAERAAGAATYSCPRFYDRFLMRRADPPKSKLARKAAEKRAAKRKARKAEPAPYPDETLPPPPPPSPTPASATKLDPDDGPPPSPRQRAEYASRLAARTAERATAGRY
jgi:hypothetical protein